MRKHDLVATALLLIVVIIMVMTGLMRLMSNEQGLNGGNITESSSVR